MTPAERELLFLTCARQAEDLSAKLELLLSEDLLPCDVWAVKNLLGDLVWAVENCSVMARHALGEKLEDAMGYYLPPGVGPESRQLTRGTSILEANTRAFSELRGPGAGTGAP